MPNSKVCSIISAGRVASKDLLVSIDKRDTKAKGNGQTSVPVAPTPPAPMPAALSPDLAPLDFQLTDEEVHHILSQYIRALWGLYA